MKTSTKVLIVAAVGVTVIGIGIVVAKALATPRTFITLTLTPGSNSTPQNPIVLANGQLIVNGQPLANATVQWWYVPDPNPGNVPWTPGPSLSTDANGNFTFNLSWGPYSMAFVAGYNVPGPTRANGGVLSPTRVFTP